MTADDDHATLLEELDRLKVDLALKDSYAMELSAALTERDQELAALKPALAQSQQLVASQVTELAKLRAAVVQAQVKLEEVTSRTGYRLLARASDTLERHDRLRRGVTGAARRLNRPR